MHRAQPALIWVVKRQHIIPIEKVCWFCNVSTSIISKVKKTWIIYRKVVVNQWNFEKKSMTGWATCNVACVPHKALLETLRFLCLNERNISLVAICAVIYSCKDFATKRLLSRALMHFGTKSWSKMVVRWRYADVSMKWLRNVCVMNAKSTYTTWLLMT